MTSAHGMRVAYFAEIFPSRSETWIHHEIRELQRRECAVRVFATHRRPEGVAGELEDLIGITTYMPSSRGSLFEAIRRVVRWRLLGSVFKGLIGDSHGVRNKAQVIRDVLYAGYLYPQIEAFKPDVLIAHFGGTRTNIALFYSLLSGVPYVFKMHALDVFRRVALLRMKVSKAARVLTISDYNIAYMATHYPDIQSSRIQRHACGVPVETYKFRDAFEGEGDATIVAVGRLVRMKGFDILIKAGKVLRDMGVSCRVIIVGDGPERQTLEKLREKLRLCDMIELRGYAGPDTVRKIVSEATVFVLPAIWDSQAGTQDGIPVALMEAMALGVPVVSTFTSGIPELVRHEVSGFLVEPGNEVALAEAIDKCCRLDGRSRSQLVARARQTVECEFSASTLAEDLHRILESVAVGAPAADRTGRPA